MALFVCLLVLSACLYASLAYTCAYMLVGMHYTIQASLCSVVTPSTLIERQAPSELIGKHVSSEDVFGPRGFWEAFLVPGA